MGTLIPWSPGPLVPWSGDFLRTLSFKATVLHSIYSGKKDGHSPRRGSFPSSPHLHDFGCSSKQPPPWQEATELLPCLDRQCASHCRADPAVCARTCAWLLITPECLPQLLLEKCRSSGYSSNGDWQWRAPGIRVTVARDLAYRAKVSDLRHFNLVPRLFVLHTSRYFAHFQPEASLSAAKTSAQCGLVHLKYNLPRSLLPRSQSLL